MFIGVYTDLDNKEYFNIYYYGKNIYGGYNRGWDLWFNDSFNAKDYSVLDLKIKGNNYAERKAYLEDLAKDWQYNFAGYDWSYSELVEIQGFFYENAKRYGLLKVFKENAIC